MEDHNLEGYIHSPKCTGRHTQTHSHKTHTQAQTHIQCTHTVTRHNTCTYTNIQIHIHKFTNTTHTHTHTHTHILVFGVNRGPWKIHTNNRRTRTRMSDIVRGIVDFAHLTWGTAICVWNLIDETWTYRVHVIFMLYLAHSHMNACRISNHISTISPIRGRPRLVARPVSECRMSEQGSRFPANTHTYMYLFGPLTVHCNFQEFYMQPWTLQSFHGWTWTCVCMCVKSNHGLPPTPT